LSKAPHDESLFLSLPVIAGPDPAILGRRDWIGVKPGHDREKRWQGAASRFNDSEDQDDRPQSRDPGAKDGRPMNALLSLYLLWVVLPGIVAAGVGAVILRSNRLKGALLGAVAGLVLGQLAMLMLSSPG
jgi:hypothetical protein